jgi:hypothetical protein
MYVAGTLSYDLRHGRIEAITMLLCSAGASAAGRVATVGQLRRQSPLNSPTTFFAFHLLRPALPSPQPGLPLHPDRYI